MSGIKVSDKVLKASLQAYLDNGCNTSIAAKELGVSRSTLDTRLKILQRQGKTIPDAKGRSSKNGASIKKHNKEDQLKVQETDDKLVIDYYGTKIETPEELIANSKVDLEIWEVADITTNSWEVAGRINEGQEIIKDAEGVQHTVWKPQKLWKTPLRQIKVRFRRKTDEKRALEALIQKIADHSPITKLIKRPKTKRSNGKRALEICLMDPHYGLQCYKPSSDQKWSLEECEELCMWAIEDLIRKSKAHGPFDEIIFPFGNDYMHHDSMKHETTNGTAQPEGLSWSHVFERAELLAINMVERLKEEAFTKVISVPGNHDHHSAYTLARILKAYYRNDKNIEIDASSSPYKFHRFGTNLIGFEHGHSIGAMRLPALMANERPKDWAETTYREWHLGDQHRKGTSKPSSMEEQGVSVEYLPALTPPNQWHRLKAFNWQKRGAVAFVWDHSTGAEARLQSNLDSYTGRPSGK